MAKTGKQRGSGKRKNTERRLKQENREELKWQDIIQREQLEVQL
jgi:hypothetical protein